MANANVTSCKMKTAMLSVMCIYNLYYGLLVDTIPDLLELYENVTWVRFLRYCRWIMDGTSLSQIN